MMTNNFFKKSFLFLATTMFLVACEAREETLNLEFLELQKDEDVKPRAIYVSHETRNYYSVVLSSYEYNNFDNLGINKDVKVTKHKSDFLRYIDPYFHEDEFGNEYIFDLIDDYYKLDVNESND